jgi:uncharacterized protein (DUF983 family)
MNVTRGQIIARGLTNRCPNCGGKTLFNEPGKPLRMSRSCGGCGMPLERDEGSFLGAVSLNYGITVVIFLLPVLLLYFAGVLSGMTASIVALVGGIVVPILLYRPTRSWWLMNYYLVLPQHLPANQRELAPDEDENT